MMTGTWFDGDRDLAVSTWKTEKARASHVAAAAFVVSLIACLFIPGSSPVIWIIRVLIVIGVTWLASRLTTLIRETGITVPEPMTAVRATVFDSPIVTRDRYSDPNDDELAHAYTVLWDRDAHGTFDWLVYGHNGTLLLGRFEIQGNRIRLASATPLDPSLADELKHYPKDFDRLLPHPTVRMDDNGAWIMFDPAGRLHQA